MPHSTEHSLAKTPLYVNDGPLLPDQIAWLRPTSLDTPIEEVRQRFREDGYVFLKQILPRDDVLKTRSQYFQLLSSSGILAPGSDPVEGIFDSTQDPQDFPGIGAGSQTANGRPTGPHPDVASKFVDLALQAHGEPWYKEDLCKHPILHEYIAEMTGWKEHTLGMERTLLRNNTPRNKAIGVHYDQIFLRHGEDTSVTAWVPLGDVALDGGGLIYLENSSDLGSELEAAFTQKAKAAGMSNDEARDAFNANMMSGGLLADGPAEFGRQVGRRWLLTDYEAGDVVLHTPYTLHASTINQDKHNRIRVGTDLRFVDSSRPWDQRWANEYRFGDGV